MSNIANQQRKSKKLKIIIQLRQLLEEEIDLTTFNLDLSLQIDMCNHLIDFIQTGGEI
jgi:hypothetical protein